MNEKIQARKLFDRNPDFPVIADKIRLREYLARKLGPEDAERAMLPLLGANATPNADWLRGFGAGVAVKANHASKMIRIIQQGETPQYDAIMRHCRNWLRIDYGRKTGETFYSPIRRQILVEPLLCHRDGRLADDMRFSVFDGRVQLVQWNYDKAGAHVYAFATRDWTDVQMTRGGRARLDKFPPQPVWFPDALALAERAAAGLDYVRVDFLIVEDRFFLNEMTLAQSNGFKRIDPREMDFALGAHWKLPPSVIRQLP